MKIKVNSERDTTTAANQGSRNRLAGMSLAPRTEPIGQHWLEKMAKVGAVGNANVCGASGPVPGKRPIKRTE